MSDALVNIDIERGTSKAWESLSRQFNAPKFRDGDLVRITEKLDIVVHCVYIYGI